MITQTSQWRPTHSVESLRNQCSVYITGLVHLVMYGSRLSLSRKSVLLCQECSGWCLNCSNSVCYLWFCSDTQKKPGDDVTLQCPVHSDGDITVMAWKHQSVGDVIVLRNNHSYESDQHPSVRGRVDHTYQDGVFTVTLKNVTINDSGTYECVIGRRDGAPPVSIRSISLTVTGEL